MKYTYASLFVTLLLISECVQASGRCPAGNPAHNVAKILNQQDIRTAGIAGGLVSLAGAAGAACAVAYKMITHKAPEAQRALPVPAAVGAASGSAPQSTETRLAHLEGWAERSHDELYYAADKIPARAELSKVKALIQSNEDLRQKHADLKMAQEALESKLERAQPSSFPQKHFASSSSSATEPLTPRTQRITDLEGEVAELRKEVAESKEDVAMVLQAFTIAPVLQQALEQPGAGKGPSVKKTRALGESIRVRVKALAASGMQVSAEELGASSQSSSPKASSAAKKDNALPE